MLSFLFCVKKIVCLASFLGFEDTFAANFENTFAADFKDTFAADLEDELAAAVEAIFEVDFFVGGPAERLAADALVSLLFVPFELGTGNCVGGISSLMASSTSSRISTL